MKVAIWGSALLALSWTGEAVAAKRLWDAERYTECMESAGTDELSPTQQLFTSGCRTGRDPVEASEGVPGTLYSRASVAGEVVKDDPSQSDVSVVIRTTLERRDTSLGGTNLFSGGSGGLTYRAVYAMVSGGRQELPADFIEGDRPPCSRVGTGSFSVRTCSYVQGAGIKLPQPLLAEIKSRYATEPQGVFRFRLELIEGSITFTVPLAEIEAVRRVVEADSLN